MAKSRPAFARPRREVVCPIDLDGYDGVTVKLWLNPPMNHWQRFSDEDGLAFRRALRALVLDHGFADEDGKPIKLDDTASELTSEEFFAVVAAWNAAKEAASAVPKASSDN